MADLTYDEMMTDLVNALSDKLPENFFTLQGFAKKAALTEMTAKRRLTQRVNSGELGTKLATVDGIRQRIYWFSNE